MKMDEFTQRKLDHFNETSKLFNEPCFSDLQVTCGARTWNIHKNIVCPRSKFFRGLCSGQFKEATENRVALDDDDPDAVYAMLEYLYTADYTVPADKPVSLHVAVAVVSDKYNLIDLLKLACTKFTSNMDQMRTCGLLHIPDMAQAITLVYNGPERLGDLQASIIKTVRAHVKTLFQCPGHESDVLHDAGQGLPAPMADLFWEEVRLYQQKRTYRFLTEQMLLRYNFTLQEERENYEKFSRQFW